jgi:hypothetical protein
MLWIIGLLNDAVRWELLMVEPVYEASVLVLIAIFVLPIRQVPLLIFAQFQVQVPIPMISVVVEKLSMDDEDRPIACFYMNHLRAKVALFGVSLIGLNTKGNSQKRQLMAFSSLRDLVGIHGSCVSRELVLEVK